MCEKPVSLSVETIHETLKIVEANKSILMIGFNRRFDPNFAEAERRIRRGDIGAIELVTVISRDPAPPPAEYVKGSGGLFRDMMIHDFDMARFLMGEEFVVVNALGSALVDKAIGEAGDVDTAAVQMQTASGRIAVITNSRRATYGYDQRFEVHGSKGMIHAKNVHNTTVEVLDATGIAPTRSRTSSSSATARRTRTNSTPSSPRSNPATAIRGRAASTGCRRRSWPKRRRRVGRPGSR